MLRTLSALRLSPVRRALSPASWRIHNPSLLPRRRAFLTSPRALNNPPASAGLAAAAQSDKARRVFVLNLPYDATMDEVKQFMEEKVGGVKFVEVLVTAEGQSKGCAVVEFDTPALAEKAIADVSMQQFAGRAIFVRPDQQDVPVFGAQAVQLYVGNIPPTFSWQDLKDLFKPFGPTAHVNVSRPSPSTLLSQPDGPTWGTLQLPSPQQAQRAINHFTQSGVSSRYGPLVVKLWEDRPEVSVRELPERARRSIRGGTGEERTGRDRSRPRVPDLWAPAPVPEEDVPRDVLDRREQEKREALLQLSGGKPQAQQGQWPAFPPPGAQGYPYPYPAYPYPPSPHAAPAGYPPAPPPGYPAPPTPPQGWPTPPHGYSYPYPPYPSPPGQGAPSTPPSSSPSSQESAHTPPSLYPSRNPNTTPPFVLLTPEQRQVREARWGSPVRPRSLRKVMPGEMNQIVVKSFPFETDEQDLLELFSSTPARVEKIQIIRTPQIRNLAMVQLSSAREAQAAVKIFDGYRYGGRNMGVRLANDPWEFDGGWSRESRGLGRVEQGEDGEQVSQQVQQEIQQIQQSQGEQGWKAEAEQLPEEEEEDREPTYEDLTRSS